MIKHVVRSDITRKVFLILLHWLYCSEGIQNLWPSELNALKIRGIRWKNYIVQTQKILCCFKTIHSIYFLTHPHI